MAASPRLRLADPRDLRDQARHEAGHAVGAIVAGCTFRHVEVDRWGDFGWFGSLEGLHVPERPLLARDIRERVREFLHDLEQAALTRAAVARIGVMATLGQEWGDRLADADRAIVEAARPRDQSPHLWDAYVEAEALRLLRVSGFQVALGAVVDALLAVDRLTGEEVAELVAPHLHPPMS